MSVIFQLFNTEDLKLLSAAQLEELRSLVGLEQRLPEPGVVDTIYHIASVEYLKLAGHLPAHPRPEFDPAKGLLGQFFHQADLEPLEHKVLTILQWAIECALARHPEAINAINTKAVTLYRSWTGTEPHGKDGWVE